jgi:uncharacterized protein (TIGR02722 family)
MGKIFLMCGIILAALSIAACGGKKVTRVSSDSAVDLSGRWNDTDSQLVSAEMIRDCLAYAWLTNFKEKAKKNPTVIVGRVVNKSHERINTETFTKDLERELLKSGAVDFVADSSQREEIRTERQEQAVHASSETQKGPGQEVGADYMLKGQINTILDTAEGEQVRYYQIELELINIADNKKAWIGQKKIKKIVEKASASW